MNGRLSHVFLTLEPPYARISLFLSHFRFVRLCPDLPLSFMLVPAPVCLGIWLETGTSWIRLSLRPHLSLSLSQPQLHGCHLRCPQVPAFPIDPWLPAWDMAGHRANECPPPRSITDRQSKEGCPRRHRRLLHRNQAGKVVN